MIKQPKTTGFFFVIVCFFCSSKADCPNGWSHYGASCYKLSHDVETWIDAIDVCKLDKGHLVEINTAKENNFVKSLIAPRNARVWTGGNDMSLEGQWYWLDSMSNLNYTNWKPGQPDNYNLDENCLRLEPDGMWVDNVCHDSGQYVCEIELFVSPEILG